jgi:hypothetical protein
MITLPVGSRSTYWYEVAAYVGTNWVSGNSAATAMRTIAVGSCA